MFEDAHNVIAQFGDGTQIKLNAKFILIAVGSKPIFPRIPGAQEYGISTDSLFSPDRHPGKILVVGTGDELIDHTYV